MVGERVPELKPGQDLNLLRCGYLSVILQTINLYCKFMVSHMVLFHCLLTVFSLFLASG